MQKSAICLCRDCRNLTAYVPLNRSLDLIRSRDVLQRECTVTQIEQHTCVGRQCRSRDCDWQRVEADSRRTSRANFLNISAGQEELSVGQRAKCRVRAASAGAGGYVAISNNFAMLSTDTLRVSDVSIALSIKRQSAICCVSEVSE